MVGSCAAVWALLLERTHPRLATDVIYVAGDRVVTDPLCKPFSMGRNLFCVHSKKRMDDQPELKADKQRTNRRTVVEMGKALREVDSHSVSVHYIGANRADMPVGFKEQTQGADATTVRALCSIEDSCAVQATALA